MINNALIMPLVNGVNICDMTQATKTNDVSGLTGAVAPFALFFVETGDSLAQSEEGSLRAVRQVQFCQDIANMGSRRPLADDQLLGYLLI